ncbi:MAG: type II secretion system F family protein [Peptoniphilus sp.]|uniref:type II secretion system F family protein n=1 Tax=Peptoniphilus sp. TaxID=1971214 RepID=UPI002A75A67A|nr:type II secretion system F family protein [Peptoniphilus sp.]MDY2987326.1 type II secretion system F family protein [Peptoniphilus sp.]
MIYKYTALDGDKRLTNQIEAASLSECEEKLLSMGLRIIKVEPVSKLNLDDLFSKKFKNEDLYIMFYQLYILINAKLNVPDSVLILSNSYEKQKAKHLKNVYKNILGGFTLAESLNNEKVCPKFAENMIKIGEESSSLSLILKELSNYYFEKEIFKKKIYSALTYPIILFISTVIISNFLVLYIFPTFTEIFYSSGVELPIVTRILISFSNFFRTNFLIISSLLILVGITLFTYFKTESGKFKFEKFLIKFKLYRVIQTHNFISMMSFLLNSKVIMSSALEITRDSMSNLHMKKEIEKSIAMLYSGIDLSESLEESVFFDSISLSILKVGEQASSVDKVIKSLKDYYEKKLEMDSKKFLSLIEPIIILILSIFVGFVVLSIAIPMFDVVNYIG